MVHTFFADERVISIVRIVRVSGRRTSTIPNHSEVELCPPVSAPPLSYDESMYREIRGLIDH